MRGDILRLLRQHGGEELGRAGRVARRGERVGLGDEGPRRRSARAGPTTRSMKALTWLSGSAPMKPSTGWPLLEGDDRRDRLDAELAGDLRDARRCSS